MKRNRNKDELLFDQEEREERKETNLVSRFARIGGDEVDSSVELLLDGKRESEVEERVEGDGFLSTVRADQRTGEKEVMNVEGQRPKSSEKREKKRAAHLLYCPWKRSTITLSFLFLYISQQILAIFARSSSFPPFQSGDSL